MNPLKKINLLKTGVSLEIFTKKWGLKLDDLDNDNLTLFLRDSMIGFHIEKPPNIDSINKMDLMNYCGLDVNETCNFWGIDVGEIPYMSKDLLINSIYGRLKYLKCFGKKSVHTDISEKLDNLYKFEEYPHVRLMSLREISESIGIDINNKRRRGCLRDVLEFKLYGSKGKSINNALHFLMPVEQSKSGVIELVDGKPCVRFQFDNREDVIAPIKGLK